MVSTVVSLDRNEKPKLKKQTTKQKEPQALTLDAKYTNSTMAFCKIIHLYKITVINNKKKFKGKI